MPNRDLTYVHSIMQRMAIPKIFTPMIIMCERLNEPCAIKDKGSRILHANLAYLSWLGLPKNFSIHGKTLDELPVLTPEFYAKSIIFDRLVEQTKQRKYAFVVHSFGQDKKSKAVLIDKTPLFLETGDVFGTILVVRKLTRLSLISLSHNLPAPFIFDKPDKIFTDKEWSVIFLLENNFSRKEIASELNISTKYLNNLITVIFEKAGVNCARNLVHYIHDNGWDLYTPERFIKKQFHIF